MGVTVNHIQPTITNVSQFVFLLGGDIKYIAWREALRQPLYVCLAFTLQEHKNFRRRIVRVVRRNFSFVKKKHSTTHRAGIREPVVAVGPEYRHPAGLGYGIVALRRLQPGCGTGCDQVGNIVAAGGDIKGCSLVYICVRRGGDGANPIRSRQLQIAIEKQQDDI